MIGQISYRKIWTGFQRETQPRTDNPSKKNLSKIVFEVERKLLDIKIHIKRKPSPIATDLSPFLIFRL